MTIGNSVSQLTKEGYFGALRINYTDRPIRIKANQVIGKVSKCFVPHLNKVSQKPIEDDDTESDRLTVLLDKLEIQKHLHNISFRII